MSQKVYITHVEEKISGNTGKKYWSLDTDQGKMGIFDSVVADEILKMGFPNEFNLVVQEKGNFKNVTGIELQGMGQTTETPGIPAKAPVSHAAQPQTSYIPKPSMESQRFAGMAISYAKDLVVAKEISHTKLRDEAIAMCDLYKELVEKLNK